MLSLLPRAHTHTHTHTPDRCWVATGGAMPADLRPSNAELTSTTRKNRYINVYIQPIKRLQETQLLQDTKQECFQ